MRPFGWPRIVLTVYGTSFSSCYHTPLQVGVDSLRCTITQGFFLTSPYIYRCYSVYRTYIYIYYTYLLQDIFIYLHTLINIFLYVKKETHVLYTFLSKHAGNPTSPEALTFATVEWWRVMARSMYLANLEDILVRPGLSFAALRVAENQVTRAPIHFFFQGWS